MDSQTLRNLKGIKLHGRDACSKLTRIELGNTPTTSRSTEDLFEEHVSDRESLRRRYHDTRDQVDDESQL